MAFLYLDGSPVCDEILNMAGFGMVIRRGEFAIKIPRLREGVDDSEDEIARLRIRLRGVLSDLKEIDMREFIIEQIYREKWIFQTLSDCEGVVPCFDLDSPDVSICMRYMGKGSLRSYLESEKENENDNHNHNPNHSHNHRLDQHTRVRWLKSMAHTLSNLHRRRVIVTNLRSDNFLIDDTMSIYLANFGECSVMPLTWDMSTPNLDGEGVATDIGQFGAVMFEVITGHHCTFDMMQESKESWDLFSWPPRDSLPSTEGVWLGHIIEKCWTQGEGFFASADDLVAALEQAC
ncbi:serine/threonine protein kinase [Capronia epimyces CBS 606.96]|uniref:Serine/threonine protein kinase n=1 Tax=Capronia epimyces CBS 606.96 TaxID=1182542 RepID=W9XP48_9EURO|nr:serine/threonine protein kinase [Capronia epimyces CBS 606.96]EXJ82317.1 serine/threonine protein kinase [Capronia epimyces CBS 606.96]